MSALATQPLPPSAVPAETPPAGPSLQAVRAAVDAAAASVPPLWPLDSFVAVNPFLGFTGRGFASTAATLRRVAGVDMLMPRRWYRARIESGAITDDDLLAGIARAPKPDGGLLSVADLKAAAAREPLRLVKPKAVVATVAEVLDRLAGGDRHASRTAFMIDEISRWCAAYFDAGQAAWPLPGRHLRPYAAWRAAMRHDRNPEAFGIAGFRSAVAALPDDPVEAIAAVVAALGIPERAVGDYCLRALFDILGWAAYARHLAWRAGQEGRTDDRLVDLLAIRLVWGYALFQERRDAAFRDAWAAAMVEAAALPADGRPGQDPELAVDLALHAAFEAAHQRGLVAALAGAAPPAPEGRPGLQAAFCIDVRSEVIRRALEAVVPDVETVGFAGFFGFPIDYVRVGRRRPSAQAPVLLKPSAVVCEAVSAPDAAAVEARIAVGGRIAKAWKGFKTTAVSSFTFVETAGLGFAARILADTAGRPARAPSIPTRPDVRSAGEAGAAAGLTLAERTAMAAGALRGMSIAGRLAPLVLLVGHGSTSVNNPHAAGLDCGACGGHSGEANARVAAMVLNDPEVRRALAADGLEIPHDTVFLAGLHDTTTDAVTLFVSDVPTIAGRPDIERLAADLAAVGALARRERAGALGIAAGDDVDAAVLARSRDWSQVRPEWGLAGNAAFIAAPRTRTAGLALDGRAFLHSYDWRRDEGFKVLELIMTAPMVVASWINLAYYGSVVNNRVFGAGDKTLHNVVGTLGVLEGNGGDLRIGLPWQSVHDGERLIHEPLRLSVVIDAPLPAIEGVVARHAGVRDLVENGWIHLFALTDDGVVLRRSGPETWISEARASA